MSISEFLLLVALLAALYHIIVEDRSPDIVSIPRFTFRVQIRAQICWYFAWE